MGWWADLWKSITDYIANAIRWIFESLTEWIENLRVSYIIWKHKLKLQIAGWLEDDTNLVIALLGIIALTVLALKTLPILLKSAWWEKVTGFIASIKTGVGTVLATVQYQVLLTIHQVSLVLFEPYRNLVQGFYSVLSALAAELAQDAMFLNLGLRAAQGTIVASYALMGQPMPTAEAAFLLNMRDFVGRFETRFSRYAKDPEQIFLDIDREIVGPAIQNSSGTVANLYKTVSDTTTKVQDFVTRLDNFRESIDTLIETLPDEIEEVIAPKWQGLTDKYDSFMNEYVRPTLDTLNQSIEIIDSAIARNDKKIADIEAEQRRLELLATTTDITGLIAYQADLKKESDRYDRIYAILNYQPGELPLMMLEEKPHKPPVDVQVEQRDNPFVGDF